MRICFFSHGSQTNQDGASLSMINVINELTRRGHSVIAVMAYDRNLDTLKSNPNVKVIFLPSYNMRVSVHNRSVKIYFKNEIKNIINNFYWAKKAYNSLKCEKIDVIHINGLNNGIGAIVAKKLRIPYVWHIRQLMEDDLAQTLFNRKQVYPLVSQADCVIGISKAVKDKFEPVFKCEVTVVYNGVPVEEYMLPSHDILNNIHTKILLAGRVAEGKGHMEAVKAMEVLKSRGIDAEVIFVGHNQGHYGDAIKEYVDKNGLSANVIFLEHVSDLRELRSNCDIGLLCSKKEAFGRVTIETQLSKMLFIGTNTGATPEIIQDYGNGIMYQQGSPEDLANKIVWAIDNKNDARKIAEKGYDSAIKNYSIQHVVDQLEEIYKRTKGENKI